MKKFLSLFIALAMVFSLFAGVGAKSAKAATAPAAPVVTAVGEYYATVAIPALATYTATSYNLYRSTVLGTTGTQIATGLGGTAASTYNDFIRIPSQTATTTYYYTLQAVDTVPVMGTQTAGTAVLTQYYFSVTPDSRTLLPTYTMGTSVQVSYMAPTGTTTLSLMDGAAVIALDSFVNGGTAVSHTFTLISSLASTEGTYTITDGLTAAPLYLAYVITGVPTTLTLNATTSQLISGKFSRAGGAAAAITSVTLVSPTGVVTTSTILDSVGNFFINAIINEAGTWSVYVTDGRLADYGGAAYRYAKITVGSTLLTVTHVLDPEVIYAGQVGFGYIYVTDDAGAPVTAGLTLTQLSGVTGFATMTELGLSGFYQITGTPASAGTANYKISGVNVSATFSMNFAPLDSMWNPTIQIVSAGTAIDSIWTFAVNYNPAVANYALKDQLTNLSGPLGASDFVTLGGTDAAGVATISLPVQMGGQIGLELNSLFWKPFVGTALTAESFEAKKSFKVNPAIVGDIVTVSLDTVNVGDTKDITVNVKQPNGIERNNGKVIFSTGVYGMFTVPTGAIYTADPIFGDVTMNASLAYPNNLNIVGGNYVFAGLKFNHQGYVDVKVYDGAGNLSAHLIEYITVNPTMHTLTADVAKLVAGQVYPSVKVSGAVTGLTFTPGASIDNGDGSYIFNFSAGIAWASAGLKIKATSGDDVYQVILPIVKPTITITSVHKDGLITDSRTETVIFTVTDPVTGAAMIPSVAAFFPQFNAWAVTGNDNLQVSQVTNGTTVLGTSNEVPATATTGNPNVDYTVDTPFIGLSLTLNGKTVNYYDVLTVTDPSLVFKIAGMGDELKVYQGVQATVTATALDAHKVGLKNAFVAVAGLTDASWATGIVSSTTSAAGGITGADGVTVFSFTPVYIGNYKMLLSLTNGGVSVLSPAVYLVSVAAPADVTAPVITVTAGIDGSTVATDVLKLTGSLDEKVSALYVNFNKVDVMPDGSFATMVKLNAGENAIDIVAYDLAGNKGAKTIKVTFTAAAVKTVIVLTIGTDVVTVDGRATSVDAAPEIVNSRTFVPIRFISETFGATVEWLPETQGITITLGDSTIGLQIGNATAVINGNIISLPAAPYIKNSRTMVPLRVISESFGGDVVWDAALRTITISYAILP
ncbi:MAG: stalk domain-containing protein [Candidatus Cryosericum sp.]